MTPLRHTRTLFPTDHSLLATVADETSTGSPILDEALTVMRGLPEAPPASQPALVAAVEPWIAQTPSEAWAWIQKHPAETWQHRVGAYVAAEADRHAVDLDPPPATRVGPWLQEVLAWDHFARKASRGEVLGSDPRLTPEGQLPFVCVGSWLAAWGAVDPVRAWTHAMESMQRVDPSYLQPVLPMLARGLVAHGESIRVRQALDEAPFLSEAATFLEAGACGGAFEPDMVRSVASALAPRVVDELDMGDRWRAALPLLRAAASAAEGLDLVAHLNEWRLGDWQIVNLLIDAGVDSEAAWGWIDLDRAHPRGLVPPDWWKAARDTGELESAITWIRARVGPTLDRPHALHQLWRGSSSSGAPRE